MTSLLSILDQLRIPYQTAGHQHVRPGWIGLDCPWCDRKGSGKFHLGVNLAHGYATCWKCGYKKLVHILRELSGRSYPECYRLLEGMSWDRKVEQVEPSKRGKLKIPMGVGPLWSPHCKYLQSRGFDPDEIIRLWGVQGIGLLGPLAWRLWLPIVRDDITLSWTTRAIGDSVALRYRAAAPDEEIESPKRLLYGADYVRNAVVVCEGPFDVWAIGPGAVALMGLSYSRIQLELISRYPVRVICFDSEVDAQRRARELAANLRLFPGETYVVELESGKDAAEADRQEIRELRQRFLGDEG